MTLSGINTLHTIRTTVANPIVSIAAAIDVWRSRRALAHLDAHALDDIGVSRDRAAAEAAKPMWDVPANWRL